MFEDKSILITGGTRGIGYHLVKECATRGAKIVATGRSFETIEKAKLNLGKDLRGNITWMKCDLTNSQTRSSFFNQISLLDHKFDGIFHNAGIMATRDITKQSEAAKNGDQDDAPSTKDETEVNLVAPIELTEKLLPEMASSMKKGFICFVSSGLALTPRKANPIYCATKAGIRSFSKSLRAQCKAYAPHISIIEALPPLTDTDLTGPHSVGMNPADVAAEIVNGIEKGCIEIYIGSVNMLRWILWLAPTFGENMIIHK